MRDIWLRIPKVFGIWIPIKDYIYNLDHWTEFTVAVYIQVLFLHLQVLVLPFAIDGCYNFSFHLSFLPKIRN